MRLISETELKEMTKEQCYIRGYRDGYIDILNKTKTEMNKCKTFLEMQIAERDIKSKVLISDIFCHVVEIIDKYKRKEK